MKKNISTLEKRNAVLIKKNNFLKQESSRMANAMNQMKAEFDDQEQYIRRDCLEIRWIPMSAKDDTNQIIKNVESIVARTWGRNECVTNEPQRTSAGRLSQSLMFLLRITTSPYPTEWKVKMRFLTLLSSLLLGRSCVRDALYKAKSKTDWLGQSRS